ncbi:MAG: DUF4249 domain-containing protein [Muribaculaceae bacterium]|nr:DUF4249 domain-containing protein [Muribaculaceae bacterium]
MAILRKICLFLLPFLLTGCFTDFDPKIKTKPVLCLNSLITSGKPIEVNVTHTWIYTDEYSTKYHEVKDAEIKIYANGDRVDADYLPKEGDHIRIEAESPVYGRAEAEVDVPYAPTTEDIGYTFAVKNRKASVTPPWGLKGSIKFDIDATLDMQGSPEGNLYYRLGYDSFSYFDSVDSGYYESDDGRYEDTDSPTSQRFDDGYLRTPDPIFNESVSEFEEILGYFPSAAFFSDHSFVGGCRTIHFQFDECEYLTENWKPGTDLMDCGYFITLFSISKSYFDWAMYYWQNYDGILGDFSDMGFAEPIWGYSNVSTGAGVVAAQSSVTFRIDIKEFLNENFGKYMDEHYEIDSRDSR